MGWISRSFRHACALRRGGKRIEAFSRTLYHGLRIAMYALIGWLLFF